MKVPPRFSTAALAICLALPAMAETSGPARGTLLAAGGGDLGPEIVARFLSLAGGPAAPIVVIPTADARARFGEDWLDVSFLRKAGAANVTLLHTRDRAAADSTAFVEPLRKAAAVWFSGGRHWRLVDSYLNTRTHRELQALLDRGGVVGGSSAGATILASYLVRGAREGAHIMMAPGYEQGLGFLRDAAIDQHLLVRRRQDDLVGVVAKRPELLGIGIDEGAAVVVQGARLEVIGRSKVAIYEHGKPYYFLNPGDRLDLNTRSMRREHR